MERLTPEYLESQIHSEHYVRPEGCGTLTICVLTMRNGLHIVGESACLNPADFDAAMGERIARQNAFSKLWQLEGYARASAEVARPRLTDADIGKLLDMPEEYVARQRARLFGVDVRVGGTD